MTLPGETLASFHVMRHECEECAEVMVPAVYQSQAGWYVGFLCTTCGPYSRESRYYRNVREAREALVSGNYGR